MELEEERKYAIVIPPELRNAPPEQIVIFTIKEMERRLRRAILEVMDRMRTEEERLYNQAHLSADRTKVELFLNGRKEHYKHNGAELALARLHLEFDYAKADTGGGE